TKDVTSAEREQQAFRTAIGAIPRETPLGALNNAGAVFDIATEVVDARIAAAKGDRASAVAHWKRAADAQDRLAYDEPPSWYYPARAAAEVSRNVCSPIARLVMPGRSPMPASAPIPHAARRSPSAFSLLLASTPPHS